MEFSYDRGNDAVRIDQGLSRRAVLGLGALGGVALLAGTSSATPAVAAAAERTAVTTIAHPGMLHSAADLAAVTAHLTAAEQPWQAGLLRLNGNGRSSAAWSPRPLPVVVRGGAGSNYAQLYIDIAAAYQNALRWQLTGDAAHGTAAVRILNAWSAELTQVTGDSDRYLAAGIYGYQFANAAELMRDHPDFLLERFVNMMLTVFYPLNNLFLLKHNDAVISNYWANWDLCNMNSVLAIGILADRQDLIDQAITYFRVGAGMGSIAHVVPFLYDGGLGQWQESGRDQGHTTFGVGLMGAFCEMAWNQGYDCYGYDDSRFLKGAQYVAKYNLGNDVPFTTYWKQSGTVAGTKSWTGWSSQTVISANSRGQARPIWDAILGHYNGRLGLDVPWVQQMAASVRPEGGGGDYGPASGGYDQLGFTTLTSYRTFTAVVPVTANPAAPAALPAPVASPDAVTSGSQPTPAPSGSEASVPSSSPVTASSAPARATSSAAAAPSLVSSASPSPNPSSSPLALASGSPLLAQPISLVNSINPWGWLPIGGVVSGAGLLLGFAKRRRSPKED